MNRLVAYLLAVLVVFTSAWARTYYVSPNGNSSNSGDDFNNALDLRTAVDKARAGDIILLQNGTHHIPYSSNTKNTIYLSRSGNSGDEIYIMAADGERAVIDFSFPDGQWVQDSYGFDITGDHWYFKNVDITRAGYQGVYNKGAYNTFENCNFYNNRNTGLEINKGGSYTTVKNCDAYRNFDPKKDGSMADGFGPKQQQGSGNKFIGCRAWENSDDGYDCFDSEETVTFENCWAFRNGINVWGFSTFEGNGNGFKVGGNHVPANNELYNCVAFGHPNKGFDQNNNTGGLTIVNCTSFDNGDNYGLGGNLESGERHYLRNNISISGSQTISNADQAYNTWNSGFSVSSTDFISLNRSLATVERHTDGSIPYTDLFRLKPSSSLVDAGTNVGLPYTGSAPDLGAFETNSNLDCAGVENGNASIDECGICSGGSTNISPCPGALQAEEFCSATGIEEATNSGFVGNGYLNLDNAMNSSATWYIQSPEARNTTFGIRVANGSGTARGMNVLVNGVQQTSIEGNTTGAWTTWTRVDVQVSLEQGVNEITLEANTVDGGPNIDLIAFDSNELEAAGCNADCNGEIGGNAYFDDCNTCVGGSTGLNACAPDCNGDINGTAFLDDCGVCVQGNTGFEPCNNSYEAELACEVDGVKLESTNTGFSGEGYINTDNVQSASARWLLISATEQEITFSVRYANGGTTNRDGSLFLNGNMLTLIEMPTTTSWSTWEMHTTKLTLAEGVNEVVIEADSEEGLANIDVFHFSGDVSGTSCTVTAIDDSATEYDLSLYPNPTGGILHLSKTAKWQLITTDGKILDEGIGTQLDLRAYTTGLYYIKTQNKMHTIIKK